MPLDRRMETLSGGERTRIGIARLLIEAPDLILLDEPTNNLDATGRAAIHALVRSWHGGVVAASHDRQLLESMDRIVELTPIGVRIFGGGWSAFANAREADRTRAAAELERANAAVREAQRAAQAQREAKDRRDKAGRAFAAKGSYSSREKAQDMTAPSPIQRRRVSLDQRAASRDDKANVSAASKAATSQLTSSCGPFDAGCRRVPLS
jgi:ATPase subunit of ABC transporter with duplicated ATPase domains